MSVMLFAYLDNCNCHYCRHRCIVDKSCDRTTRSLEIEKWHCTEDIGAHCPNLRGIAAFRGLPSFRRPALFRSQYLLVFSQQNHPLWEVADVYRDRVFDVDVRGGARRRKSFGWNELVCQQTCAMVATSPQLCTWYDNEHYEEHF